ncbi:unnamed protein product [Sympodiomycopsis kandeliae]
MSGTDPSSASSSSLLDIISTCHNYPYPLFASPTTEEFHAFHLYLDPPTPQIGFIPEHVFRQIQSEQAQGGDDTFVISTTDKRIGLSPELNTFEKRSKNLNQVVSRWRDLGLFKEALDGWRNEKYAIYASNAKSFQYNTWSIENRSNRQRNPAAFELERSACALFGLVTFGVHLTAYTIDEQSKNLSLWTPRRASNKATWPDYLDNSVAGGITSGDLPRESIIRECWEEAGLPSEAVTATLKQVGVLSYVYRTDAGYLQPEVEYVYDLLLPNEVIPKPIDGEAQDFQLLQVDDVRNKMASGQFKPNCALVIIDFLIRHGVITAENEPRYLEANSLLHNDIAMPGP